MAEKTPAFKDVIMPLKAKATKKASHQVSLGYTLLTFARYKLYFLIPFYALLDSNFYKKVPRDCYNLSFEIGKEALKARQKGKGRIWLLPFKIINLKKRFQLEKLLRESC